jgi:hypothetical protein
MSGFKLYEIDNLLREAYAAAEEHVDQETGEIPEDWDKFLDDVQMERDQKALAVAAMYREFEAERGAIADEAKRLAERARAAENKAKRLKAYLAHFVQPGEKLKDARVSIGWRKSTAVIIEDESRLPEECWKVVRTVSKTSVKEMLGKGEVDGARIEARQNIQIR